MDERATAMSRRAMLGASAVGVGAAALGGLSMGEALAAQPRDGSPMSGAGAALGLPVAALPPTVPGTYVGVADGLAANPWNGGGTAGQASWGNGAYALNGGFLTIQLPLQPGDELVRVDTYFSQSSSSSAAWFLDWRQTDTGIGGNTPAQITNTGVGIVSSGYQPASPLVVAAGQSLFIEADATSASSQLVGAIFQYRPAQPRLNLLDAPVRVYDSRPGNLPNTAPKTPLVGGTPRTNIAANNNGSGVPVGARAILANVTVVNTVGSGFLLLYKNGISVPLASTVNWSSSGQVLANGTTVALDAQARFSAFVGSGAQTDFFVDVLGYYL